MDKGRQPEDRPRREDAQPAMDEERQIEPGEEMEDDRSIATEDDDEELELDDDDEELDDEDEGRPARPVK